MNAPQTATSLMSSHHVPPTDEEVLTAYLGKMIAHAEAFRELFETCAPDCVTHDDNDERYQFDLMQAKNIHAHALYRIARKAA